ncbi:MAG: hypothetical protein HZC51_12545 [Nitrospirae bacterium]|nr:hypothetical protein [Nitrospirota bacterium]
MCFDKLIERLDRFEADPGLIHTKDGAVELLCADCDFYKDSDKDLECGAFKLLRRLLDKKALTLRQISDAVRQ